MNSTRGRLESSRRPALITLVHLELALWKAACKLSAPSTFVGVLEWMTWSHSGWKAQKSSMRRHPLTGITALVAPFLGLKKKVADDASSDRRG
jgi:hypothetical protein